MTVFVLCCQLLKKGVPQQKLGRYIFYIMNFGCCIREEKRREGPGASLVNALLWRKVMGPAAHGPSSAVLGPE